MLRYIRLFIFLALLTNTVVFGQEVPIVPLPQEVVQSGGSFAIGRSVELTFAPADDVQLSGAIKEIMDICLAKLAGSQGSAGSAEVWAGIAVPDGDLAKFCAERELAIESVGEEGYLLIVEPDRIVVAANKREGLLYGLHSLSQLANACSDEAAIPCYRITDYPEIADRAVMDDISRGPLPNMEYAKSQIRRLSSLKINHFSFYIEHVVKTQENGSFAPKEGISIDEIRELSEYAREWNVELIGSFQSLGHFDKILGFPQYRHLGFTERMLNPGDPEVLAFLTEVYDELAPAFSSEYFNINCDEAWDLRRLPETPPGEAFADHIIPLIEHVKNLGKKPMLWGDMLLQYPEVIDQLPEGTIVLTWDYGAHPSFDPWIDAFASRDIEFWVIPGVLNSERLMPNFTTTKGNLLGFISEGFQKGATGVMNTVWDDGGRHFFSKDWYGVAYGADRSWNPDMPQQTAFDQRFDRAFYGDVPAGLSPLIDTLLMLAKLPLTNSMTNYSLGLRIIPDKGEHFQADPESWQLLNETCRSAKKQLELMGDARKSVLHIDWATDLQFWELQIEQLLLWSDTHLEVFEWARRYDTLCMLQRDDPEIVLVKLKTLQADVQQALQRWAGQRSVFEILWLFENRTYWTEEALELYNRNIAALADLEDRLDYAVKTYAPQKGAYLPAPHEIRLDIKRVTGKYFTYWLMSDQFAIESYSPPFPDFLAGDGGEANIRPSAFEWQKYQSPMIDRVNLKEYHTRGDRSVAYAYCRVQSDKDRRVRATFGSNDGIEIFLNGEKVFSKHEKRSLILDEDEVWLDLKAGTNHLLLKVDQWKSDWGFSFRMPDVRVVSRKYRYYVED